jgi:LAGLIDADG endonuclease
LVGFAGKIILGSQAVYYVVQKLSDLTDIIIPFFDKYPLQGVKVKDFEDFKHAAKLMESNAHLTEEGLEEIRKIILGMNTFRK